jgi:hypothetical protein
VRGAEESPRLEAVVRERLVKQAGKGLVVAVEISGGAVIIYLYLRVVSINPIIPAIPRL